MTKKTKKDNDVEKEPGDSHLQHELTEVSNNLTIHDSDSNATTEKIDHHEEIDNGILSEKQGKAELKENDKNIKLNLKVKKKTETQEGTNKSENIEEEKNNKKNKIKQTKNENQVKKEESESANKEEKKRKNSSNTFIFGVLLVIVVVVALIISLRIINKEESWVLSSVSVNGKEISKDQMEEAGIQSIVLTLKRRGEFSFSSTVKGSETIETGTYKKNDSNIILTKNGREEIWIIEGDRLVLQKKDVKLYFNKVK